MSRQSEMWKRVHELSCTHSTILRADECEIYRKQFADIINKYGAEDNKESDK
jgi:hypothetical protein